MPKTTTRAITVLDAQARSEVMAHIDGDGVLLDAAALEQATGFTPKPEGFCKGPICVPAGDAVDAAGRTDLVRFAARLGRPIVVDLAESVVSLGAAAADRGARLTSLEAPDFALPDLQGRMHSLAEQRGKKVLLAAYASW